MAKWLDRYDNGGKKASTTTTPTTTVNYKELLKITNPYPTKDMVGVGMRNLKQENETAIKIAAQREKQLKQEMAQASMKNQASVGPTHIPKSGPEKEEADAIRAQRNMSIALSNPDKYKYNYDTKELVIKENATPQEWSEASYMQTPELVQTAAIATPSGRDYYAGTTGANLFVNAHPWLAPITSTGRIASTLTGNDQYGIDYSDGLTTNNVLGTGLVGLDLLASGYGLAPGLKILSQPMIDDAIRAYDAITPPSYPFAHDVQLAQDWGKYIAGPEVMNRFNFSSSEASDWLTDFLERKTGKTFQEIDAETRAFPHKALKYTRMLHDELYGNTGGSAYQSLYSGIDNLSAKFKNAKDYLIKSGLAKAPKAFISGLDEFVGKAIKVNTGSPEAVIDEANRLLQQGLGIKSSNVDVHIAPTYTGDHLSLNIMVNDPKIGWVKLGRIELRNNTNFGEKTLSNKIKQMLGKSITSAKNTYSEKGFLKNIDYPYEESEAISRVGGSDYAGTGIGGEVHQAIKQAANKYDTHLLSSKSHSQFSISPKASGEERYLREYLNGRLQGVSDESNNPGWEQRVKDYMKTSGKTKWTTAEVKALIKSHPDLAPKEVRFKYEDGGSIESRMGGLTDIPFNYNSAWGGQFEEGGLIKAQYGCHGKSCTMTGDGIKKVGVRDQPEPQGKVENYVPLSNAPVTWEELQTYNETDPKSKDFKNRLKNLQGQFPGLTQQQLLAAGADSARIKSRINDLPKWDMPVNQTYDRAWYPFYRGIMQPNKPVTVPEILQYQSQQPGGLQGYEQMVRGNYNKPKAQLGGNVYPTNYVPQAQNGERLSFDDWYKTVPLDKNDTTSYNLRRAYDLAPQEQLDAFVKDPKAHLVSVYENPQTGVYEFMKRKDHPTIQKELNWFYSNTPEAKRFRNEYTLDKSGDYYKYVRKHAMGGSIPGSTGFTYARTGSIPSNGKYAKKTLASAQNGLWTPNPKIDYPEDRAAAKSALENLPIYSPDTRYQEWQGEQLPYYKQMIDRTPINIDPKIGTMDGPGGTGIGGLYYGQTNRPYIYPEKGLEGTIGLPYGEQDARYFGPATRHELLHSAFDSNSFIPNWMGESLEHSSRNPQYLYRGGDHSDKLAERAVMAIDMREHLLNHLMRNNEIKDKKIQLSDDQIIPWLKQLPDAAKRGQDTQEELETMRGARNYNDVKNLLNATYIPKQQNGGMTFYQHGLDWKPKTISENGSIIPIGQTGVNIPGITDFKQSPAVGDNTRLTPKPDVRNQTAINNAIKFGKDWINSPMYKQMLQQSIANSTNPSADENIAHVRQFITDPQYLQVGVKDLNDPNKGGTTTTDDSNITKVNLNSNSVIPIEESAMHEIAGHAGDMDGMLIPTADKEKMNKYFTPLEKVNVPDADPIKIYAEQLNISYSEAKKIVNENLKDPEFAKYWNNNARKLKELVNEGNEINKKAEKNDKYLSKPSETRARMMYVRQQAKARNVYDPFTQKMTRENLRKLKESNIDELNDLYENYTEDEILDMFNSISMNQSSDNQSMAKNGSIIKAQNGLSFLEDPRSLARQMTSKSESTSPGVRVKPEDLRTAEINKMRERQGSIKQSAPERSAASKAWAVATHPMTALQYKVKGQNIPEHFERGELNPYETAVDLINPLSYVEQARQVKNDLGEGNYLAAGIGALGLIPGEGSIERSTGKLLSNEERSIGKLFKSDIDWSKWNSEIPSNKTLIDEYHDIERTTKANGSWMKNPDGSLFKGTPEQFVQQNSQNFKKAFGNTQVRDRTGSPLILHHGSEKNFTEFLTPSKGITPELTHPKMNYSYFHFNPDIAAEYSGSFNPGAPDNYKNVKSVYINSKNPLIHDHVSDPHEYIKDVNLDDYDVISSRGFGKDYNYDKLTDDIQIEESEVAVPYGNYVKSATGNNGMFDMTNPNIYKGLVPVGLGIGLASQMQNKETSKQKKGGVIKDDRGQWAHPGEITEIGSNNITMQGVPYPVLGISDIGHTQMMLPGEDYKFKGKKVTEFPMAQNGKRTPVYVNDPNDPRLKLYTDSVSVFNRSQNPWFWQGTNITTKQDYEKKQKLEDQMPQWSFDEDQYKKDKKKGVFKDFNDYMYDVHMTDKDPKALDAFNRNVAKYYEDLDEPFEVKLPDGRIKQYWTKYKGKIDDSQYDIYDPVTGSTSIYTHSAGEPDTFLLLSNPNIKPIGYTYRAFDAPHSTGETTISSEDSDYINKVLKNRSKKKKNYTNYTYGATANGIYKQPVQPVIYDKKKYNPNDPRLKQLQESFDKFHSGIRSNKKEQPKPEEPTLKKRVSHMDIIPISKKSSSSPKLRTLTGQAPNVPPTQMGEYRTSYYDPQMKDWNERAFMTQAESDAFANEMSQRGYPGAYGNVTQTKKVNKKSTGGWLNKYK